MEAFLAITAEYCYYADFQILRPSPKRESSNLALEKKSLATPGLYSKAAIGSKFLNIIVPCGHGVIIIMILINWFIITNKPEIYFTFKLIKTVVTNSCALGFSRSDHNENARIFSHDDFFNLLSKL